MKGKIICWLLFLAAIFNGVYAFRMFYRNAILIDVFGYSARSFYGSDAWLVMAWSSLIIAAVLVVGTGIVLIKKYISK